MFGARFWLLSAAYAVIAALFIGLPTVLIPNSFFMRMTPTSPIDYLVWIASDALIGPLLALMTLYPASAPLVVRGAAAAPSVDAGGGMESSSMEMASDGASGSASGGWRTLIGGIFSYFSVGCPVCNKIVLLFLGASGAMSIFNPLRPFLGASAVALLAVTLYLRVRTLRHGCPV